MGMRIQTPSGAIMSYSEAIPPPPDLTGKQRRSSPVCDGTRSMATSRVVVHSLWDYLKEEVLTSDMDDISDVKSERVKNFLDVPRNFEQLMLFGYFVCLDAFLYIFTILPIRVLLAALSVLRRIMFRNRALLTPAHVCDIYSFILFATTCCVLEQIDASRLYHFIRGQAVIKLYVIFNVLEILDRLCCSFGQDIFDSFFARIAVLHRAPTGKTKSSEADRKQLRFISHFFLALAYVFGHTIVLFYQSVTLNVAINSHSNALLTLLLSNQFVEIKGSVFKKFERENLFQLTCSDIVERFQLSVFLMIITMRNLIELSASSSPLAPSPFPKFLPTLMPMASIFESLLAPVIVVTASELVVDWLKHAFITKFNGIRPSAYGRFEDVLCSDLAKASTKLKAKAPADPCGNEEGVRGMGDVEGRGSTAAGEVAKDTRYTLVDQSRVVARRIGFAAMPLACLVTRMLTQTLRMLDVFGEEGAENSDGIVLGHSNSSSFAASNGTTSLATELAFPRVLTEGAIYECLAALLQNVTAAASNYVPIYVREVWEGCCALAQEYVFAANARLRLMELMTRLFGEENVWFVIDKAKEHADAFIGWVGRNALCGGSFGSWTWARTTTDGIWVLVALVAFVCVVSLKIMVGIHLLNYAHRRLEGHVGREARDKALADEEKQQRSMERKRFHKELLGVGSPKDESEWKVEADASPVSLETIDRYTLFRSRIP